MNIEQYKKYELVFNIVYIVLILALAIGLFAGIEELIYSSIVGTVLIILMSRFNALQMRMAYEDKGSNSIQIFYPSCLNIIYIVIGALLRFSKILFFGIIFVILYLIDTYLSTNIITYLACITFYLVITAFLHEYGFTGLFVATGETSNQIKGYGVSPRNIVDENKIEITIYKYRRLKME